MAIAQERIFALLHEMEELHEQVAEGRRLIEEIPINHYTKNMALSHLRPLSTPSMHKELGHFKKVAKANAYRTMKYRAQKDSLSERPLLANRTDRNLASHKQQNPSVAEVAFLNGQVAPIDKVDPQTKTAIEQSVRQYEESLSPHDEAQIARLEAAIDQLTKDHPHKTREEIWHLAQKQIAQGHGPNQGQSQGQRPNLGPSNSPIMQPEDLNEMDL